MEFKFLENNELFLKKIEELITKHFNAGSNSLNQHFKTYFSKELDTLDVKPPSIDVFRKLMEDLESLKNVSININEYFKVIIDNKFHIPERKDLCKFDAGDMSDILDVIFTKGFENSDGIELGNVNFNQRKLVESIAVGIFIRHLLSYATFDDSIITKVNVNDSTEVIEITKDSLTKKLTKEQEQKFFEELKATDQKLLCDFNLIIEVLKSFIKVSRNKGAISLALDIITKPANEIFLENNINFSLNSRTFLDIKHALINYNPDNFGKELKYPSKMRSLLDDKYLPELFSETPQLIKDKMLKLEAFTSLEITVDKNFNILLSSGDESLRKSFKQLTNSIFREKINCYLNMPIPYKNRAVFTTLIAFYIKFILDNATFKDETIKESFIEQAKSKLEYKGYVKKKNNRHIRNKSQKPGFKLEDKDYVKEESSISEAGEKSSIQEVQPSIASSRYLGIDSQDLDNLYECFRIIQLLKQFFPLKECQNFIKSVLDKLVSDIGLPKDQNEILEELSSLITPASSSVSDIVSVDCESVFDSLDTLTPDLFLDRVHSLRFFSDESRILKENATNTEIAETIVDVSP